MDAQIIQPVTVDEMVTTYKDAEHKIRTAYDLLERAQKELDDVFGRGGYTYFEVLRREHTSPGKAGADPIMQKNKVSAWRCIINQLGIKKILSIKRADELDKNLETGEGLPEIEVDNILEMMAGAVDNSNNFMKEAALEVFDILRPGKNYDGNNRSWHKEYKTNAKNARFELGKKIILTWWIENTYSGGFRVSYYKTNELQAVDRIFHALDGKGVPGGYQSPLIDAINSTKTGEGETDYFRFKCYGNKNLHLEFRRMDLVQRLNVIAGNPTHITTQKPLF